jgi:class 3 adenylate cyclase
VEGDRAASDADRSLAIASLREAAKAGALDIDELQVRLDAAVRANTVAELASITWEARLPVMSPSPPIPAQPPPGLAKLPPGLAKLWRNTGFRVHSTVYGAVNTFLLGTWALTGGLSGQEFFWPFFPIAAWGIGIAAHGAAVGHSRPKPYSDEGGTWTYDPEKGWSHQARTEVGAGAERAAGGPARSAGGAPGVGPGLRYVTVMFVDVANSTALNEAIGDEAWSRLRARHLGRLRECVSEHQGAEVSTSGDGLFARFDRPAPAVACAVEIERRIEAELEQTGFAPQVRIGIHAGEAVEEESDLIGNMVNLASRVAAVAAPGEICVTEPVADKVSDRFHLEDRGLHTLKGVARPRHLLSVKW